MNILDIERVESVKKGIVIISILLGVCIIMFFFKNGQGNYSKIYRDESILKKSADQYSFEYRKGGFTEEGINLECKFSGVNTLCDLEVEEKQEVKIAYSTNIKNGKFKVILVDKDGISLITEESDTGTKTFILPEGKYAIKMVGDEAEVSLQLSIESSGKAKVTPKTTSIFEDDWME